MTTQAEFLFNVTECLSKPETVDGFIGLTGCAGIPATLNVAEGPITFDLEKGIAYNSDGTVAGFIGLTGCAGIPSNP